MTVLGVRAARMQDVKRRVERRLSRVGAHVSTLQLDQLVDYLVLLERWNQRMNLTSLDDPDMAVDRLIVEPVLASSSIDPAARTLVDVGSGGGSPAFPLKIVRPELSLTMIEVKTRKSVFLREVIRHLGITAATVENARFEQVLGREDTLGSVNVVSIRAVRAETEQLQLFGEALRHGGQQLWFLSGTQTTPPVPSPLLIERELPLVEALRSRLVVIRKLGNTKA
jgi:16S rRNA (guanine527-N7)-methyltransferase